MVGRLLKYTNSIFDTLKIQWESKNFLFAISVTLVAVFVVSSLLSLLVINDYLNLGVFNIYFENPFFSIEIAFTLLLITELISLIFILPKSVAKSVGKQFEFLSLIFLRDGFKEFSHISGHYEWQILKGPFINMMIYGFGAVAIFSIMGLTYKLQRQVKLTSIEDDQEQFVSQKKLLALFLIVAFMVIGFNDVHTLFTKGIYLHSFKAFYTVLIFSDIIIVLIALRYTLNYYKIFRYSAFVLATILIRISLSAQTYYDVIIGIVAALFILAVTVSYNYFIKELP